MTRFLTSLSGARAEILALCPTERPKFQSLAWAILISCALAAVSMWFALSSEMGVNPFLALPFALGWGVVVLGVSRWLVVSIPGYGRRGWAIVLPRLLLDVVLGLVVAVPLVLRGFQTEIDAQIAVIREHAHNAAANGLLIRWQALDQLASQNSAVNVARLLLSLLFVLIQCLPLIVKLMQRAGTYDAILQTQAEQELRLAMQAIRYRSSVRSRSFGDRTDPDAELKEIWQRPRVVPGWVGPETAEPGNPLLAEPEESDEHAWPVDEALRTMTDVRTTADADPRGGIPLRWDDDDL